MDFKKFVKSAAGFVVDSAKDSIQGQVRDYEKYSVKYSQMSDEQLQRRFDKGGWHSQAEMKAFKEEIDARGIHLKKR